MSTPTPAQLKARYPAFAQVDADYIEAVIAEASRFVDPRVWCADDVSPAIMAIAAHKMVGEGALGGNANGSGVLASDKLGDASQTFGSVAGQGEYGTTAYGRAYLALLRVNVPAVLAV